MHQVVFLTLWISAAFGAGFSDFNDEFNDPSSLSNWNRNYIVEGWPDQMEIADVDTTTPDNLHLVPYTCGWYREIRAPFFFKTLPQGNFVMETRVHVSSRSGPNDVPSREYSLGGLFLRRFRPGINSTTWLTETSPGVYLGEHTENYVFLSMGTGDSPGTNFQLEVKTTVDSISTLQLRNINNNKGRIQVARVGDIILLLYKIDGESDWTIRERYHRTDFNIDGLEAGVVVYTDWEGIQASGYIQDNPTTEYNYNNQVITDQNPDLIARFEYIRFCETDLPEGNYLMDISSDSSVLNYLGDNAFSRCNNTSDITDADSMSTNPTTSTAETTEEVMTNGVPHVSAFFVLFVFFMYNL